MSINKFFTLMDTEEGRAELTKDLEGIKEKVKQKEGFITYYDKKFCNEDEVIMETKDNEKYLCKVRKPLEIVRKL